MHDLRTFLDAYSRSCPDGVLRIQQKIDRRYEITALLTELEKSHRFPVVVCENVCDDGVKFPFKVATFIHSSRKRLASLLDTVPERLGNVYNEHLQKRIAQVVVPKNDAPVKENIVTGEKVDLKIFPALIHHDMDPGPYITAGYLTCYDPDTGVENSAIHRGWIKARNEIRVYLTGATHNALIFGKNEARSRDTKVAYWIGHHPLVVLGCEAGIPFGDSHYATAGGFIGEPLRLTPSETLGEDFLVPADAEVVIEGIMPHGQRRPEGPFGEYTRYFGPQKWNPFIKVTAITYRRDAFWESVPVGHTHWLSSLAREGMAFDAIKRAVPTVKAVYVPMSGCGVFHLYIQLENLIEGSSRSALIAGLLSHYLVKHAFVFDEDVNIFDETEVLHAMATRFQGDRDLVILPGLTGPALDPSAAGIVGTKVGFDCTKPLGRPFAKKLSIPGEIRNREGIRKILESIPWKEIPEERS
ncbi:MAG: UbiD family decarboxylase [Deltaproteobacteria bacterium]|nr:UbiD family decarboxylase [Deltaproteobacteria bacterium]